MADADGGQLLSEVERIWPRLGTLLRNRVFTSINQVAQNAGVAAVGNTQTPAAPNSIAVKTAGELVHVAITDNSALDKGTHYFTEMDTDPSFPQPMVHYHGPSRTGPPFQLPTNDDTGSLHSWYFRTYSQKPGSLPSAPVVYGGNGNPLAVTLSGSTSLTPIPSTGSGTSSGNGQTGGVGFGKVVYRPVPAPKRSVG